MENLVYYQLSLSGFKVKVGVLPGSKEIDFIAEKGGEFKYFQVANSLFEGKTIEREFGNLLTISDNYEKFVVTYKDSTPAFKGIKTLNLREFLSYKF